jgi:hypothetical protein
MGGVRHYNILIIFRGSERKENKEGEKKRKKKKSDLKGSNFTNSTWDRTKALRPE